MSFSGCDPFASLTRSHTTLTGVRVFAGRAAFLDEFNHIWLTSPGMTWPEVAQEVVDPLPCTVVLFIDDMGHVVYVEPEDPSYDDSPEF